jgi:A/G-specific adenine glycosylase
MLQQTQASRAAEAFPRFMARFPTVTALASASRAEVLRSWTGLGYPRRAVFLHQAARTIQRDHRGGVPQDPAVLRSLPGVGPYTAGAVASIAYGVAVSALDTNAIKVMARVAHGVERDEITRARAQATADAWLDPVHPGEWNQAVMNLGRSICRTRPRCAACPLHDPCLFRASGRVGRPAGPPQPSFEGSLRQVRGAVMASVREGPRRLASLVRSVGHPRELVREALVGLTRDGLVEATPAALAGHPLGRVRLPGD